MDHGRNNSRRRYWLLLLLCLSVGHHFAINAAPSRSTLRTALSLPLLLPVERLWTNAGAIGWTAGMVANSLVWAIAVGALAASWRKSGRLLVALWLALIVSFVATWIDSYRREFALTRGDAGFGAVSFGRVYLLHNVRVDPLLPNQGAYEPPWRGWYWSSIQSNGWPIDVIDESGDGFSKLGFAYRTIETWDKRSRRHALIIPCWFVAALLVLLPPMLVTARRLARRRVRAGCCIACGYDLRASPDRCPECGTNVAS